MLQPNELEFAGVTRTVEHIPSKDYIHRVFDWWLLDEFEAQLHDTEQIKQFSPRPLYFYELAITEIRMALSERAVR